MKKPHFFSFEFSGFNLGFDEMEIRQIVRLILSNYSDFRREHFAKGWVDANGSNKG